MYGTCLLGVNAVSWSGLLSDVTCTQVTYPLDTLRLRIAVDPSMRGIRGASTALFREGSYSAFFRGLTASLIGIFTLPCLCFRCALLVQGASTCHPFCSCCNACPALTKDWTAADNFGMRALSSYDKCYLPRRCELVTAFHEHLASFTMLRLAIKAMLHGCCRHCSVHGLGAGFI